MARMLQPGGVAVLLLVASVSAATFHVANSGDDGNPGTMTDPFGTLQRARDAVRAIKRTETVTVIVHGGTYIQNKSLDLDASDSGTSDCTVTWQAAENESVRIVGGPMLP